MYFCSIKDIMAILIQRFMKKNCDTLKNNGINYFWSFIWVFLILFFAYAPETKNLLKNNAKIDEIYFVAQSSFFSMVINFGIIVMLIFDIKHKEFQNISLKWVIFSFVAIILMYGHAMNISGENRNVHDLIPLLSCQEFGFLLVSLFIWLATHIKFLSKRHLENIENESKNRTATTIT